MFRISPAGLGLAASGFLTALASVLSRSLARSSRHAPQLGGGGFRKSKPRKWRRDGGRTVNGLSVRSLLRAMRAGDAPGRLLVDQTPAERARKGFMHSHARQMFYRMQQRVDPRFAVL